MERRRGPKQAVKEFLKHHGAKLGLVLGTTDILASIFIFKDPAILFPGVLLTGISIGVFWPKRN